MELINVSLHETRARGSQTNNLGDQIDGPQCLLIAVAALFSPGYHLQRRFSAPETLLSWLGRRTMDSG